MRFPDNRVIELYEEEGFDRYELCKDIKLIVLVRTFDVCGWALFTQWVDDCESQNTNFDYARVKADFTALCLEILSLIKKNLPPRCRLRDIYITTELSLIVEYFP